MSSANELTLLLQAARSGDSEAYNQIFQQVYGQLRQIAHRIRWEQGNQETLNTTALVHEVYLKISGSAGIDWEGRSHFMGVAARAMRHLLINYARNKIARKRGGKDKPLSIESAGAELPALTGGQEESLLDLHQALETLSQYDPRQAELIECRFFGGMTIEDTAQFMGLSVATVKREWVLAKAWLHRQLNQ
ncbi:MAG: sigma-70 family RNA polymerase sigma factor [Bacteroidia bacterium]